MKSVIATFIALSAMLAGLTGCRKTIVVETANMVIHPGAHKGDVLVFENPGGTEGTPAKVIFPFGSPCTEGDSIPITSGKQAHCTVRKDIKIDDPAHYPFYIAGPSKEMVRAASPNSSKKESAKLFTANLKCPQCCPQCQIVITGPKGGQTKQGGQGGQIGITQTTGDSSAVEIIIDSDDDNLPAAADATAIQGKQITWIRAGTTSIGWSVTFDDPTPCSEGKTITATHDNPVPYCTIKAPKTGTYTYKITLDGKTVGKDMNELTVFVP